MIESKASPRLVGDALEDPTDILHLLVWDLGSGIGWSAHPVGQSPQPACYQLACHMLDRIRLGKVVGRLVGLPNPQTPRRVGANQAAYAIAESE